ncbi:MAG: TonB-dependent receptor plug domain-containing protein [Candidatus Glassbacteria bacterium]|nr:TonB-dependent receptor plug domain-containing protein [Candidatus Glassbacteria bacterium]
MKSNLFPPSIAFVLLTAAAALSQSTGKIEGVVTDKESGAPMAGAQVTVQSTTLGNITNAEGYFFILNVPPGSRSLRFNFTGYAPAVVEGVQVQAGNTARVNAAMEMATFQMEMLVIEADPEPMVPRDNVQTKQRLQSNFGESMPVNSLNEALSFKAGVVGDEAGRFSIRGGRLGKEAVYIDGILVRAYAEQSYLSDKVTSDNSPLVVGKNSVEEVNVITGGFNAEYGQAQSGVINIISREGADNLGGAVQLISDGAMPRGSDFGYNQLSGELSVPAGLPRFSSLFLSAELSGMADTGPGWSDGGFRGIDDRFLGRLNGYLEQLGLYDRSSVAARKVGVLDANSAEPGIQRLDSHSFASVAWSDGNGDGLPDVRTLTPGDDFASGTRQLNVGGVFSLPNPARLPGNSGDVYSLSGKFIWYVGDGLKLLANHMASRNQRIYYRHENIFNAPARRNPAERVRTSNTIVGVDLNLAQSAETSSNLILRASFYTNNQHGGVLTAESYGRSTFGGFGFGRLEFIDEDRTGLDQIYQAGEGLEPDGVNYPAYNSGFLNPFASTFTPLPGLRGQDNPANPLLLFNESGLPLRLVNDRESRLTVKGDYDGQLHRYIRFKTGVEMQRMEIDSRHFFYVGGPLQDAWHVEPKLYSGYAQNRLDLGDLVLDTGLRLDAFDPAAAFPAVPGESLPGDPLYEPGMKFEFSPRIEVGFPVTDKSQLRLSYGTFTQVPAFSDYYSLLSRDVQQDLASDNINNYFGNGRLDIPRTTAFEAGLTNLLTEDIVLDFVGYNKDITGNVAYRWLTPAQLLDLAGDTGRSSTRFGKNLLVATNGDHGNVKGFDISFSRRHKGFWSATASYSLTFARSTASDPQEFARAFGRQIIRDPITGQDKNPEPPSQQSPTDTDQTHSLNLQARLTLPPDFLNDTWARGYLANTDAFLTWHFHSGRPYTVVDRQGALLTGENNNGRTASVRYANLRITRRFPLDEYRRLSVFLEVMNLFNDRNIRASRVNPTTGQPGVDRYLLGELERTLTSFTTTPEPVSVAIEAERAELSPDPAERLILARIRDVDGDGLVEYTETFALSTAALLAAMDSPRSYMRPREIRLGIRLDF